MTRLELREGIGVSAASLKPGVVAFRVAAPDCSSPGNSPASPQVRLESSSDLVLSTDNPARPRGEHRTYYIHPRGLSAGLRGNYLHQHGLLGEERTFTSVFTADASVSFELPRKRGLISLKVANLTDERYTYLADPLALDLRVPRRQIRALVRIYF